MKLATVLSALVLTVGAASAVIGGDQEILPGRVAAFSIDQKSASNNLMKIGEIGDMFHLFTIRSAIKKEDKLRTFKVQLTGDAVTFIAVVEVPLMLSGTTSEKKLVDTDRQAMSCFFKANKVGETLVKITPIGLDGKEQETKEITLKVVPIQKQKGRRLSPGILP